MRQRIAQRLKDAQNINAMLTTFNEIDMRFEERIKLYIIIYIIIYYDIYTSNIHQNLARKIFVSSSCHNAITSVPDFYPFLYGNYYKVDLLKLF